MTPAAETTWTHGRAVCARACWGGVLAVHMPALLASWWSAWSAEAGAFDWADCLTLTASVVFFALKVLDVPFLRLETNRTSIAVMVAAVILIHSNAIASRVADTQVPWEIPLAASAVFAMGFSGVQRVLRGTRGPAARHSDAAGLEPAYARAFRPRKCRPAYRVGRPRSPPGR